MAEILFCGLGLIGQQRLYSTMASGFDPKDICFFDPGLANPAFYSDLGIRKVQSVEEAISLGINRACVAVPHIEAFVTIQKLLAANIRVLAEKPPGRNLSEAKALCALKNSEMLSIGFNYRHMPAVLKLKELLSTDFFGTIHSIKLQLGHGGSPDDANSWKLSPQMAGGGALLDPGIHLLDLLLHMTKLRANEIEIIGSSFWKGFWNTGIEEQFMGLARTADVVIHLEASIVRWRTSFVIEISGSEGYCHISGRGRSEGPQVMTIGKRWAWLKGKSQIEEEEVFEFGARDASLDLETRLWLDGSASVPNVWEVLDSMILENLFRQSAVGTPN